MSGSEQFPNGIDLEAAGLGHLAGQARAATFAPNWRSVLAADASVGLLLVALGVAACWWVLVVGIVLIALGAIYVFLVVRRFLQWRWLRQQVGLD